MQISIGSVLCKCSQDVFYANLYYANIPNRNIYFYFPTRVFYTNLHFTTYRELFIKHYDKLNYNKRLRVLQHSTVPCAIASGYVADTPYTPWRASYVVLQHIGGGSSRVGCCRLRACPLPGVPWSLCSPSTAWSVSCPASLCRVGIVV